MDHDFSTSKIFYAPADFTPTKCCSVCGARVKGDPSGNFDPSGCPGNASSAPQPAPSDRCECGSYRALGIGRGSPGHSDWCPWAAPK